MLHRRTPPDSAIGWISTVDSLLLGFGLMVAIALHTALTRQDEQASADRTTKALEEKSRDLADLQSKEKQWQSERQDLEATKDKEIAQLSDDLKAMKEGRDEVVEHARRLQEQVAAEAEGADGAGKKLSQALVDRDAAERKQSLSQQQLKDAISRLEDANRKVGEVQRERDSLIESLRDEQAERKNLEDRLKNAQADTDHAKQEAARLTAAIDAKAAEMRPAEKALEDKQRDLDALKAAYAEAKLELERLREEASKYRSQLDEEKRASMAAITEKNTAAIVTSQAAATDVLGFKGPFKNVVFIVDISHSMTHRDVNGESVYNPRRWNKTKREIVSWVRNLKMESLRIVFFNNEVRSFPGGGFAYPMTADRRKETVAAVEALLEQTTPRYNTDTPGAFRAAYTTPGVI
jgi:septal ring factor EnvC (AmiA/AmiB activator)